jgi:hypothetical protein
MYAATEIKQVPVLRSLAARNECCGDDTASTIEADVCISKRFGVN